MPKHKPHNRAERARETLLATAEDAYEVDPNFADRLIGIADDLGEALHEHGEVRARRRQEVRSLPPWRGEDE